MKQNVVVLDFDGLLAYPGFRTKVLDPLIEQGKPFLFWTFSFDEFVRGELKKMGLEGLASEVKIVDNALFGEWNLRAEYLIGKHGEIDENEARTERLRLTWSLDRIGIPSDEDGVKVFLNRYREYDTATTRRNKYPPLLGEDNYLLIESDSARYDPINRVYRRINPQEQIDLARRGTHSLILVPEYPDVWAPELARSTAFKRFAPDIPFSPEDIMDELAPFIINWNGEHLVRDLGVERGLFEAEGPVIQESESRHPERQ